MPCRLCGAPNANKSTCPLNSDAKHPNYSKHNAKQAPKKLYPNPYLKIKTRICKNISRYLAHYYKSNNIDINSGLLWILGFKTRATANINIISITKNARTFNKITDYFSFFCDIYTKFVKYKVDRFNFFSNPQQDVQKLLNVEHSLKQAFINFIINERYDDGGCSDTIDIHKYVEDIVDEREQIAMEQDILRISLPIAPVEPIRVSSTKNKNIVKKKEPPLKV